MLCAHQTWDWTKNGSRLQEIPDFFDEVEERIEPQLQSSNADHRTDHQLQSSNENLTADDSIDQPRSRKSPAWMIDYVSGDDLSDDDSIAHFALFSNCDPVTFQEAVKDSKWQKAMNEEVKSIEKNNTWELSDLPKG